MKFKKYPLALFFALSFLLCVIRVYGQEENHENSRLYYTADSTRFTRNPDDSFVKELMGNVRARHMDSQLEADNGVYTSHPSEIRFFGRAVLRDSIRQIEADTLIYKEKTREALALGNVRITEKNRYIRTNRVYYQKERWFLSAEGSVKIHDDSLKADIYGTRAEFRRFHRSGVCDRRACSYKN